MFEIVEEAVEDVAELDGGEVDVEDAVKPVPLRSDVDEKAVEDGRLVDVDETVPLPTVEEDDVAKFVLVRLSAPEERALPTLLVLTTELILVSVSVVTEGTVTVP